MKSSVVVLVLVWLLFEIYELYGMEHDRALLVMVDSLVMVDLALKASTADHSERERESQDQDECIYDQERSGALPRTNNAKIKRELQQNEFRFYE